MHDAGRNLGLFQSIIEAYKEERYNYTISISFSYLVISLCSTALQLKLNLGLYKHEIYVLCVI